MENKIRVRVHVIGDLSPHVDSRKLDRRSQLGAHDSKLKTQSLIHFLIRERDDVG